MSGAESLKVTLERSIAGRRGSTAWQLGMPVRPYVWRRNDPDRDAKMAAERAYNSTRQAAWEASVAVRRARKEANNA